jgi:hypothetical protein
MDAAARLGARIPWTPRPTNPKLSLLDQFFLATFDRFARAALTLGRLRFILPNGAELCYGSEASAAAHAPASGACLIWLLARAFLTSLACRWCLLHGERSRAWLVEGQAWCTRVQASNPMHGWWEGHARCV